MRTIETTVRALALGVLLSCGACDSAAPTDAGTAKPEPSKVDAGEKAAEPAKPEPAKPEPVAGEPAKPELAQPEPTKPEPVEPADSPSGRTAVPTLEDCLFGCDTAKMSEADTASCRARCKNQG